MLDSNCLNKSLCLMTTKGKKHVDPKPKVDKQYFCQAMIPSCKSKNNKQMK